jgi:hypothetical protein
MTRRSFAGLLIAGLALAALAWLAGPPFLERLQRRGLLYDRRILDPASIEGTTLDEAAARQLFAPLRLPGGRFLYDREAWLVLAPDHTSAFDWPEHPDGRIVFRTNNLGFREDRPTEPVPRGLRILVTGDSHTEGAVNNAESFANVLERMLAGAAGADAPVEVLNAGVGGTAPHNHLALLRKHLPLQPDVFIAVLFAGNDFAGALMHSDFLTKRRPKARDRSYFERFDPANQRWPTVLPQGFNQAYLFRYREGDAELALTVTLDVYEAMARECAAAGVRFLVIVLPTKIDADLDDDREHIEAIREALALTTAELAVNRVLSERLARALAERGIECLDLTHAMAADPTPFYWRQDHHLNVAGHTFVAGRLFEHLQQTTPALSR